MVPLRTQSGAPPTGGTQPQRWPGACGLPMGLAVLALLIAMHAPTVWAWPPGMAVHDRVADEEADQRQASLLRALASQDPAERRRALVGLAAFGDERSVAPIVKALRDEVPDLRMLAEGALWAIWMRPGDKEAAALLQQGTDLLDRGLPGQALPHFDAVIERAPGFAEGYNKRATALYELGDYEGSLADIAEALRRNPYHFGAMSGEGLCLIALERLNEAVRALDRALAVNPNMDGIRQLRDALRVELNQTLL